MAVLDTRAREFYHPVRSAMEPERPAPEPAPDPGRPIMHTSRIVGVLVGVAVSWCLFHWGLPPAARWAFGVVFALLALGVVGRAFYLGIIRSRSHIHEWLATLAIAGLAQALLAVLPLGERIKAEQARTFLAFVVVVWAVAGAGWGWRCAQVLEETKATRRLGLMAIGWLGLAGLVAAFIALVVVVVAALKGLLWPELAWLSLPAAAALLAPAIRVELRCRRKRVAETPAVWKPGSREEFEPSLRGAFLTSTAGQLLLAPLLWLVSPLVLRLGFSLPARIENAPAGEETLPEKVRSFFASCGENFKQAGFASYGAFYASGQVANATLFMSLWARPEDGTVALGVMTFSHVEGRTIKQLGTLALGTHWADGSALGTSNQETPQPFGMPPGSRQFPAVAEFPALLRVHEARIQAANRTGARQALDMNSPGAYLNASYAKEAQRWVADGYFLPANSAERLRPTWKGIRSACWRSLWPGAQIENARLRAAAAATLDELGFLPDGNPKPVV